MRKIDCALPLVVVLASLALAGCGSGGYDDGSSGNDGKIASAKASEQTEAQVRDTLAKKLDFYSGDDFYSDDDFKVAGGNCTIILVLVGSSMVDTYKGDAVLKSPNRGTGVKVGTYEGTPLSDCLTAVKSAMGW